MNKLIQFAVMVAVGALIFSTLLIPIINDAQKVAGPEVQYNNIQTGYTYRLTEHDENVRLDITGVDGDIYFNDQVITDDGFTIVTNTVTVRASTAIKGFNVTTPTQQLDLRVPWSSNFTITFNNGTCTITNNAGDVGNETVPYSWMFSPSDNGEWVTATGNSVHYVNSIKDIICAGYYSTGENDTGYLVRDGVATVANSAYNADVEYTLTPVDNTTDVFRLTALNIIVGDEEFNPWFVLIKRDITGHEASGATYDIIGVIPLIVIVGLVAGVVGVVAVRRGA